MLTKAAACPIGTNITACALALSRNNTAVAAKHILEANALPCICGRVCAAPCLKLAKTDIPTLQSFTEITQDLGTPAKMADNAPKVAIVGAGPAGLAAAHELLSLGIRPVVYESEAKAGGLLYKIIPEFALPRQALAKDIENLEKMGVDFRLGTTIGKDVPWQEIDKNYPAKIVTTGAGKGFVSAIPGAGLAGVTNAINFCSADEKNRPVAAESVVVEGGGLAALMVARLAKQRGASHVVVVHAFPIELWPVETDDIERASKDGIELLAEHRVKELWGTKELEQVIVRQVENPRKDGVGRLAGGDEGRQRRIPATTFVATSQRKPVSLPELTGITKLLLGNVKIDSAYRMKPGWYAAGEIATGPDGIINAMATGKLAAKSVKKDLEAK